MKRARRSAKCDLSNSDLRFIMTVISSIPNNYDKAASFVEKASECLRIDPTVLSSRLNRAVDDEIEFKAGKDVAVPGKMPRIFGEIQDYTPEATAEREKLDKVSEIVRRGKETDEDILGLLKEPIVRYCRYCRYLGYSKDHYMNHNLRGGHDNDYICPATFMIDY